MFRSLGGSDTSQFGRNDSTGFGSYEESSSRGYGGGNRDYSRGSRGDGRGSRGGSGGRGRGLGSSRGRDNDMYNQRSGYGNTESYNRGGTGGYNEGTGGGYGYNDNSYGRSGNANMQRDSGSGAGGGNYAMSLLSRAKEMGLGGGEWSSALSGENDSASNRNYSSSSMGWQSASNDSAGRGGGSRDRDTRLSSEDWGGRPSRGRGGSLRGRSSPRGRERDASMDRDSGRGGNWMSSSRGRDMNRGSEYSGRNNDSSGMRGRHYERGADRRETGGMDTGGRGFDRGQRDSSNITETAMDILKAVLHTSGRNLSEVLPPSKRRRMDYEEEDDYRHGPPQARSNRGRDESPMRSSFNNRYNEESDNSRWGSQNKRDLEGNRWGPQSHGNSRVKDEFSENQWGGMKSHNRGLNESEHWGRNSNEFGFGNDSRERGLKSLMERPSRDTYSSNSNRRHREPRSSYDDSHDKRRKPLLGPYPEFEKPHPKSLLGSFPESGDYAESTAYPSMKSSNKPLLGPYPGHDKPKSKSLLGIYPGESESKANSLLGPYPGHSSRGSRSSRGRSLRGRSHLDSRSSENLPSLLDIEPGYHPDDQYPPEPMHRFEEQWNDESEWGVGYEERGFNDEYWPENQAWDYEENSWQYQESQDTMPRGRGGPQSQRLSVRDRLGGTKPSMPGSTPSLDLVKQLLTPEERKRLSKRYGRLPVEALYCHMCNQKKFTNVDSYLMHQIGKKHVAMTYSFHSKSNANYQFLKAEAKKVFRCEYNLRRRDAIEYCDICDVPKWNNYHHLGIPANLVIHRFVRTICCNMKFSSRLQYENHKLSLKHLETEYSKRKASEERAKKRLSDLKEELTKMELLDEVKKIEKEEEKIEDVYTVTERIKKIWALIVPTTQLVSQEKLPEKIVALKTLREINLRTKKPVKNLAQLVAFDPAEEIGVGNMIISAHYRCSICSKSIEPTQENVIEHCKSEEHYNNAVLKKKEMEKAQEAAEAAGDEEEEGVTQEEEDNEEHQEEDYDEPMEDLYEGESGDINALMHDEEEEEEEEEDVGDEQVEEEEEEVLDDENEYDDDEAAAPE